MAKEIQMIGTGSREEWLELRKNYIGGSDAGAVAGMNPYQGAYAVWLEKTGRAQGFEGNLTTEVGRYLEDFVAKEFERQTGKKTRNVNRTMVNAAYPWACADIDRSIVGENALLECKTTNSLPAMKLFGKNEYPGQWYCQMVHYLAVTGRDYVWFCVLFRDSCEIRSFRVERDDDLIAHIEGRVDEFWENVMSKVPPTNMSGTDDESGALAKIYANHRDDLRTVSDTELETAALAYETVSAQIKALEKKRKTLADSLCRAIGDDRGITLPAAKRRIVWIRSERTSYDTKRLVADHPDIAAQYAKTSTVSGGLRITSTK